MLPGLAQENDFAALSSAPPKRGPIVNKPLQSESTTSLPARASQVPTFPFDTLKKRLQASDAPRLVLQEARVLLAEGGPMRFYRGFMLKCGFVALNSAIFNTVFVQCRWFLRMHA